MEVVDTTVEDSVVDMEVQVTIKKIRSSQYLT